MQRSVQALLTPEEVAERLRMKPATVRGWLRSGGMKGVRIGRVWRIDPRELEAFLETRSGPADEDALTVEDLAAIRRGLADIKAGRVVPWETLRRELHEERP